MQTALVVVTLLLAASLAGAAWLAVRLARSHRQMAIADGDLARLRETADELRASVEGASRRANDGESQIADLNIQIARLDEREQALEQRARDLEARRVEIARQTEDSFNALAAKALSANNEQFLRLAGERLETERAREREQMNKQRAAFEELVKPIGETLRKADDQLTSIERDRVASFARVAQQMKDITRANMKLRDETARLGKALREPHVRGRYGEIQLQRVAELAGMTAYCDFSTQESSKDEEGRLKRPDMVVKLPNDRQIAVDAKTNIRAYLDAIEAETRDAEEMHLDKFAQHVVDQAKALSQKRYWSVYDGSPDFVVMFIPGDQFLDAALSRRPELLELAAERQVILASPSTLIGLLRAVAVGWREQKIAERADNLLKLGTELHERAGLAFRHAAELGDALSKTVERYNRFVGSVDTRLTPTLKKFEDGGVRSSKDIPALPEINVATKQLESQGNSPVIDGPEDDGDTALFASDTGAQTGD